MSFEGLSQTFLIKNKKQVQGLLFFGNKLNYILIDLFGSKLSDGLVRGM